MDPAEAISLLEHQYEVCRKPWCYKSNKMQEAIRCGIDALKRDIARTTSEIPNVCKVKENQ